MRKFIQNSILFLSPFLLLLVILPVNQRLKYIGLKDDCFGQGLWIHDRMKSNAKKIDLAFFGSSHTINTIDDEMLSKATKRQMVNFGYCRLGNNLQYILLQELLRNKALKMVVYEVRETEDRYSHPVFPMLASTREILLPKALFNRDIISDAWVHFAYKVELTQDYLYNANTEPFRRSDFGYTPHKDTARLEFLNQVKKDRNAVQPKLSSFALKFYNEYPFGYLDKIYRLCAKNKVELVFLYLPAFGSPEKAPSEIKKYQTLGKIWLPPADILQNPDNWYDENHLNRAGGQKISKWLTRQLNSF